MMNLSEYHKPNTLVEAMALLARAQPKTVALGGGTWLNGEGALGNLRHVQAVVDVSALGLNEIQQVNGEETGKPILLRMGAAATHQQLVEHELVGAQSPSALHVIGAGAALMSGLNIRNRATLAGAICTADSSSPLVTALLACDADVVILDRTNKSKTIALPAFLDYRQRILDEGTLITEIQVPIPSPDTQALLDKVSRTPNDYPALCSVVKFAHKKGVAGSIRIVVGGVAPIPVRFLGMEFALEKKQILPLFENELTLAVAGLNPPSDYLGAADYRKAMAQVLVRRSVKQILERD